MTESNILNPHPPEYEQFLHASVGEDRNGSVVTLLSTLARLGLDPWTETTDMVTLGRDAARARLEALLSQFRDVPMLASEHGRVARELSQLLPESPKSKTLGQGTSAVADSRLGTMGVFWAIATIIFVLFQMFMVGGSGSGE